MGGRTEIFLAFWTFCMPTKRGHIRHVGHWRPGHFVRERARATPRARAARPDERERGGMAAFYVGRWA